MQCFRGRDYWNRMPQPRSRSQADGERGAIANALTGCGYAPTVEFDDRLRNRQAETEAAEAVNSGGRTLHE